MIKICITGPESSGKTSLATQLAEHFGATLVPEFARHYLETRGPTYTESDLVNIAQGQKRAEDTAAGELIICDTGLEVIQIWSEWKYGRCDSWIRNQVTQADYDLYLLCKPDIPWQDDPLRENPNDREELFELYEKLISDGDIPVSAISGNSTKRFETARQAIEYRIKKDRH